jgi:transposase-like protein
VLNRTQDPSDVIALVVLWRLRYRLTLQDLCEMRWSPDFGQFDKLGLP